MVTGLELGAAHYMVKPFSPSELVARVRKVLGLTPEPRPDSQPGTATLPRA